MATSTITVRLADTEVVADALARATATITALAAERDEWKARYLAATGKPTEGGR